jgi:hypothetical protein
MKTYKNLTIFLLLIMLALPVKVCIPQQTEPETTQMEETTTVKDTKEKKKDKKVIEINEKFVVSLGIDLLTVLLIIALIYYPNYRKRDYIFSFIIFNIVIFLLTFVLKYAKISVGAAFGMFAVFSILRYRTIGISMKDLTYLFVFIAMGVISAIQLEYYELGILHATIFISIYFLDGKLFFKQELSKSLQYENIELIKPENYKLLIEDLRKRTGLDIHRISISKINFLRDTASIRIYYYE